MFVEVVALRYKHRTSLVLWEGGGRVLIAECHTSRKHSQSSLTTRVKVKLVILYSDCIVLIVSYCFCYQAAAGNGSALQHTRSFFST